MLMLCSIQGDAKKITGANTMGNDMKMTRLRLNERFIAGSFSTPI
jgi:hypothetical protein